MLCPVLGSRAVFVRGYVFSRIFRLCWCTGQDLMHIRELHRSPRFAVIFRFQYFRPACASFCVVEVHPGWPFIAFYNSSRSLVDDYLGYTRQSDLSPFTLKRPASCSWSASNFKILSHFLCMTYYMRTDAASEKC